MTVLDSSSSALLPHVRRTLELQSNHCGLVCVIPCMTWADQSSRMIPTLDHMKQNRLERWMVTSGRLMKIEATNNRASANLPWGDLWNPIITCRHVLYCLNCLLGTLDPWFLRFTPIYLRRITNPPNGCITNSSHEVIKPLLRLIHLSHDLIVLLFTWPTFHTILTNRSHPPSLLLFLLVILQMDT